MDASRTALISAFTLTVAACGGRPAATADGAARAPADTSAARAAATAPAASCTPLETRAPNGAGQRPAFDFERFTIGG